MKIKLLMEKEEGAGGGFTEVFLGKLKESNFDHFLCVKHSSKPIYP
jgi:hypothetical protein